ncbi:unnamed protein product [Auanema sp. JU1783]|nr:unnamed protein product [Auanema sp. JU1783]
MSGVPRFDYFQTEENVTLTVLKKGAKLEDCKVAYSERYITVMVEGKIIFEGKLQGDVDQSRFEVNCTPAKVEVKMPKLATGRWAALLEKGGSHPAAASFVSKNWDAVEKQVAEDEEKEELEGDAAVNRMFKKIYEDASDDVKKAMIKSFSESNGTVLSTNWDEIREKKVEVKPPACMEYKKFDN